jgi:hypothetical protein
MGSKLILLSSYGEQAKIELFHFSKLSERVYSIASVDGGRVVLPAELTPEE